MHRHVPRSAFSADQRGRLVIANEDHHVVASGALPQVAGKRLVGVGHRVGVARTEVHVVGFAHIGLLELGIRVRIPRQHLRPVGLVGRQRAERCVRARGRVEDEQRRTRRLRGFLLVEFGQRELIGHVPPAERRSLVVHARAVVGLLEAVERAFRPRIPEPRHHRHRAIPTLGEVGRQRRAPLGHQQRVHVRIADRDARQERDVCEPRRAAERRRRDEGRHHVAAGLVDGRVERRAGLTQSGIEGRVVERHPAVRLDEEQEDVRTLHTREVGVERRARRQRGPRRHRLHHEPGLPRVHLRHRSWEQAPRFTKVVATEQPCRLHREQHHAKCGHGAECPARRLVVEQRQHLAERPAHREVEQRQQQANGHGGDAADEHGLPGRTEQHGGHVGQEAQVPVEVQLASPQRRRGDVDVAPQHEDDPRGAEPAHEVVVSRWSLVVGPGSLVVGPRPADPPAGGGDDQRQQQHCEFHRRRAVPVDRWRRPPVAEGHRCVEEEQRDDGSNQAAHVSVPAGAGAASARRRRTTRSASAA